MLNYHLSVNERWLIVENPDHKDDRIGEGGIDSKEGSTWDSVYALAPKEEAGTMLSHALSWAPTLLPAPAEDKRQAALVQRERQISLHL